MESSLRHLLQSPDTALVSLVNHSPPDSIVSSNLDSTIANASRKRPASRVKSAYPRKRALQACRNCRVRRTKCNKARPACGSCEHLGAECNYADTDPSTCVLLSNKPASVPILTWCTAHSFDSASLAILEKLNVLEELLRGSSSSVMTVEGSEHPQDLLLLLKNLGSPALERHNESVSRHINIEAVLSWPVFEGEGFDRRLDLKALLVPCYDDESPPNMSVTADFEHGAGEHLVQNYLDNIYIFNPVVEEAKIHKYMRNARFNGLGWDAESCLLVPSPFISRLKKTAYKISS